jgi:hypothetical protein
LAWLPVAGDLGFDLDGHGIGARLLLCVARGALGITDDRYTDCFVARNEAPRRRSNHFL